MPRCGLFIGMGYPQQEFFSKGPAPSCRPMGRLSVVNPQGIEMAGSAVKA